jgi:uncharacterized membrane protein
MPITVTLPPAARQRVIHELIAELKISSFSGPLPPPEILAEYERIIPGGANRIMVMAETQAKHRQELERAVVTSNNRRSNIGLWLGFLVVMFITWAAYDAIMAGHGLAGTVLGTVDIVTIGGLFIYGSQSQRAERREKADRERALRAQPPQEEGPPAPESEK